MSIAVSCIKYLVFVFNLLFALTGLVILAFGIIIQSKFAHYGEFLGRNTWIAPIAMILIGSLIFIVSVFGCCGAAKENSCLVMSFSILLAIIIVSEIVIGVYGYVKGNQLDELLDEPFAAALHNYTDHQMGWKMLQAELECCGVDGPEDWPAVFHNGTLPAACCRELPATQPECDLPHAFADGCKPKLKHLIASNAATLGIVCAIVVGVQVIGVMFACCLYRSFRRDYETV